MKYISEDGLLKLKQIWKNEEASYWIDKIIWECEDVSCVNEEDLFVIDKLLSLGEYRTIQEYITGEESQVYDSGFAEGYNKGLNDGKSVQTIQNTMY